MRGQPPCNPGASVPRPRADRGIPGGVTSPAVAGPLGRLAGPARAGPAAACSAGAGDEESSPTPCRSAASGCRPTGWRRRLKRAGEGAFRPPRPRRVRAPRAATRRGRRDGPAAPRLAEARYRAKLVEAAAGPKPRAGRHGAVEGQSTPARGPALLRLGDGAPAMNLAVRKPRFDNRDADPDPLRRRRGRQKRARPRPAGRPARRTHADLGLVGPGRGPARGAVRRSAPARRARRRRWSWSCRRTAPSPSDDRPARPDEARAVVSGPHPAEAADRRVWRVACGGRSQPAAAVAPARRRRASRSCSPGRRPCRSSPPTAWNRPRRSRWRAFDQGVRDLSCVLSPSLRAVEVTAADLEDWRDRPAPRRGGRPAARPPVAAAAQGHPRGPLPRPPGRGGPRGGRPARRCSARGRARAFASGGGRAARRERSKSGCTPSCGCWPGSRATFG